MPNTFKTKHAAYDNAGQFRAVEHLWAEIPGTGVSVIVAAQPVEVDPADVPPRPTRPS